MCWVIDLQLKWPSMCECEIRAERLWHFSTIASHCATGFFTSLPFPQLLTPHTLPMPLSRGSAVHPWLVEKQIIVRFWVASWSHCTKEHTSMKALPDCPSLGLSTHSASDFCSILFQRAFFMPARIRSIYLLWFLKGHLFPRIEIWSSILL